MSETRVRKWKMTTEKQNKHSFMKKGLTLFEH